MFVGLAKGGKSTAIISSIIQTCRNLDINPEAYLNDILKRINNTPKEKIESLLPQNWKK
jgi:transposase